LIVASLPLIIASLPLEYQEVCKVLIDAPIRFSIPENGLKTRKI
jgi:hypothetical protein